MVAFLTRNRPVVMLVVLIVGVFGALAYAGLPRESAPDVKVPFILVTTPYIGVSPADKTASAFAAKRRSCRRWRSMWLGPHANRRCLRRSHRPSQPEVVIEDAIQRVRDRVNRAKADLAEDAEEPAVREISFSDVPVLIITIAGSVDEGLVTYVTRTAFWGFPDVTTIGAEAGEGATELRLRANAWFAGYDWGVNLRRVQGWMGQAGFEMPPDVTTSP